jgi:hypothetical protein
MQETIHTMYVVFIHGNLWPDSGKRREKTTVSTETGIVRCIVCAPGATPGSRKAAPFFFFINSARRFFGYIFIPGGLIEGFSRASFFA